MKSGLKFIGKVIWGIFKFPIMILDIILEILDF